MLYTVSLRTVNSTTLNACIEISTTSTQACRIMEISVMTTAATASAISLAHPTTASSGVTWLTNGVNGFMPEQDTGAPAAKTMITAYNVGTPALIANATTSPAIRRASMTNAISQGIIWTFPRGFYLPINSTGLNALCIFNSVLLSNR